MLLAIATPGVLRLRVETSTGSVLERDDSDWAFYQHSLDLFGGDEILTVMLESAEPFARETLEDVAELTRQFQGFSGVRRVDSLASVPVFRARRDGGLSLDAPLSLGVPKDPAALREMQSAVEADRVSRRTLISDDARAFAINIMLEKGSEGRYGDLLAEINTAMGGRAYSISGVPVFRAQADQRTRRELALFVPMTVLALGVLLYWVFGSLVGVLLALSAGAIGTWLAAAMMGSSGRPLTIATVLLPSILLANGCAYAVHVVTAGASRRGRELEEAIASIALPVALSGTTTALGFLGTATVRIDAIRDVGTFGALGVMTATFAALTVVPAGIRLAPLSGTRREIGRWLSISVGRNLVALSSRYKALLIGGWTIAVVGSVFGILLLRVQTNVITWFPKDDPVRVAYEHIRARLSGISPINIVVEAPEGQRVTQPDVIEKIEELTTRAEALPEVGRAISIADALSELHSGLTGKTTKSLPNDPQMIEQYLLLLENKPYAQDFITGDRSAANIVIRVNDNGSDALLSVGRLLEEWWAQHGPVGFKARATGIMFEFGRSEDAIARGELSGIAAAFFPISLVLFLIFRSARLTLIALIPNVLPIAMAFGAMGLAGIPLDAGTVVVGSLALGIAVDDTIHVADGYLYYRLRGASAANALEWTYARSLPAICLSSTIIAVGFLVLAFSGFALTRNLGLITSALIMLCLSADLLLFAPLLMRYGPSPSEPKAH